MVRDGKGGPLSELLICSTRSRDILPYLEGRSAPFMRDIPRRFLPTAFDSSPHI